LWAPIAASTPIPAYAAGPSAGLLPHITSEKHPKLESHLLAVASATRARGLAEGLRTAGEHDVEVSVDRVRVVVTTR
jgi:hypothetical protein